MAIYQHFRPDEKEFIDLALNWKNSVIDTYAPKLTDFLDPREQEIVKTIIGSQSDIKLKLFGGSEGTERKRAFIFPEYYECTFEDFEISLFEVDYPKKFFTLEHRMVLGSLMSLGLKRGKFGDILTEGDRIQFFITKDIEEYIYLQLESIGRATVKLKKQPLENAIQPSESWQEISVTSSSLRLDTIISAVYNISRQKSQAFVKQGIVKVNWTMIENPAFECGEGDIISVKGYGRSKIITLEGKTKKDKWRVTAGKQK